MRSQVVRVLQALKPNSSTFNPVSAVPRHARGFRATRRVEMPVVLHPDLPAYSQLKSEGVWVESNQAPAKPNKMPKLKVAIYNLMPLKEGTEYQLSRIMARCPFQVEVTWVVPPKNVYAAKNSTPGHLDKFYKQQDALGGETFDGWIVTGAPIEHLAFDDVKYWKELQALFEHIKDTDAGMLSLCWGAMASLYHFHDVPKHMTPSKQFGVIPHHISDVQHPLVQAIPDHVGIPVSRHTTWIIEDFKGMDGVQVLLESHVTGPGLVWDPKLRHAHMINHFEYDWDTLDGEYRRDLAKGTPTGEPIHVPYNYYPEDDPEQKPVHKWMSAGQVFYMNWLSTLLK